MSNKVYGVRKSQFSANNTILGSATFDFVQNSTNYKITFQNFLSQLGVSGTIVQDGDPLGFPVLDPQGSINAIRNLVEGDGISMSIEPDNSIKITATAGAVETVNSGDQIFVDNTDPSNPIINFNPDNIILMARVLLYNTGNVTIPNATNEPVSWDAAVYDTSGVWISGTDITVPAGAQFAKISVQINWDPNGTGDRFLFLAIDGAPFNGRALERKPADTAAMTNDIDTAYIPVTPGDVITAVVNQNSGGNLDIVPNSGATWIGVEFYS